MDESTDESDVDTTDEDFDPTILDSPYNVPDEPEKPEVSGETGGPDKPEISVLPT